MSLHDIRPGDEIAAGPLDQNFKYLDQRITSHEAETVSEYLVVQRDATLQGIQKINLQNSKVPKAIFINAAVDGTHKSSISSVSGTLSSLADGTYRHFTARSVVISDDESKRTVGTVTNIQIGSFDIEWNQAGGGATGNITMMIGVMYHGE